MKATLAITVAAALVSLAARTASTAEPTPAIEPPTALADYVQRPDDAFAWESIGTHELESGRVYELRLTSQRWQDTTWKHAVEIFEPKQLRYPKHALLFVTGGSRPNSPDRDAIRRGMSLATLCGARVVMLHQTPNQPLLDNRYEDDLISETWLRYLKTGDATWPLLFPMVKSAVKAMDAVGEISEQQFGQRIDRFVITGASKRGWTSWLTPVVDQRVVGTAPIVIDVLNFRAQMTHQIDTWGEFSPQINDYTRKGLVKRPGENESERELELRRMMDPFSYRQKLALPKLMIVGTNDPYWVVDSMNLYWDELGGAKFVRQVPNAGHGLQGGQEDAMASLAAFFRSVVVGAPLPQLTWQPAKTSETLSLKLESNVDPLEVRFWSARSEDNDFRDDQWTKQTLIREGAGWTGTAPINGKENVAVFGEFVFETQGIPWSLTSLVFRN